MALELGGFRNAVTSLTESLAKSDDREFMDGLDDVARSTIEAGVIKHFEFTYQLSWKFMTRWLETNVSPEVADGVTRRELFRLAAEHQLITDVDQWMKHHDARNLPSYMYESAIAKEVYVAAHGFAADARRLLAALEARND